MYGCPLRLRLHNHYNGSNSIKFNTGHTETRLLNATENKTLNTSNIYTVWRVRQTEDGKILVKFEITNDNPTAA